MGSGGVVMAVADVAGVEGLVEGSDGGEVVAMIRVVEQHLD